MNLRPTRTLFYLLWFFSTSFLLILSCSKDLDTLRDAIIKDEVVAIEEQNEILPDEEDDLSEINEEIKEFESRNTAFPSIEDAYLQNGKGYNQAMLRLEENYRTSYLMFDLSQIDSIGGKIKSARLEFTINVDGGSGTIKVYKGLSNDWTENNLSENSAPEIGTLVGELQGKYDVDSLISIILDIEKLQLKFFTLILDHENGDDLALASEENESIEGPRLVVNYDAPINSQAIVIAAPQNSDEVSEQETAEEDNDEEDTPEEEGSDEEPNEAPTAIAEATPIIGMAPLQVTFTGNKSSDNNEIVEYAWDFKDMATASSMNTTHTFTEPGTYEVSLKVTDEEGLNSIDKVTIIVNESPNESPVAVASADVLSGDAPLFVNFTGGNSSDDQGLVSFNWNFPGNPSFDSNPTYTFDNPGVYDIILTVRDAEGLQATSTLTITVSEENQGNIDCSAGGGMANDTGLKSWCWDGINIPEYSGSKGVSFSNGELVIDSECYEKQITKLGNQLKFKVNPTSPDVGNWCSRNYNMRAEIRTAPWDVRHARGTEEWFGWSYTFGNDYIIDQNNQWLFWQVHHGVVGDSPHTELMVIKDGQFSGHSAGEIYVVNNATSGVKYNPTGITPIAGEKLDIVVHAIWDTNSSGLLQVWINGESVYNKEVTTIYSSSPWGGNAKWGIYKWPWADANGVQQSQQQGISHLETYMGPLRMITRKPGDTDYGKDSYSLVMPGN